MRDEALPLQRARHDRGETRLAVPTVWNDKALDRARAGVTVEQLWRWIARGVSLRLDVVIAGEIDPAWRLPTEQDGVVMRREAAIGEDQPGAVGGASAQFLDHRRGRVHHAIADRSAA